MSESIDHYLDITEDVCPMTFVKTRLLIEKMGLKEFEYIYSHSHSKIGVPLLKNLEPIAKLLNGIQKVLIAGRLP